MDYHIEKEIIGIFESQSFRNENYSHFQIKPYEDQTLHVRKE